MPAEPKIEPVVEPKVEPVVSAVVEPAVKVEPVVAAPILEPKVEPKVEPVAKVEPKADWRDSRIAELTAKLNAAKAAKVEPPQAAAEPDADFEARVQARAKVLADEQTTAREWNERCNQVATDGKAQFPDFMDRMNAIRGSVNPQDAGEVAGYNEVLAAAIETGKGPQLLHELGADPGEFRRLMTLSPVKRATELTTRAIKLDAAPDPSSAPKPITPLGSRGVHYEDIKPDDPVRGTKLPKADWFAARQKQAEERGLQ